MNITTDKLAEALKQLVNGIIHSDIKDGTYIAGLAEASILSDKYESQKNTQGWQPIETAPKDGTLIIVYRPSGKSKNIPKVGTDYFGEIYDGATKVWMKSSSGTEPTHWMPLPLPQPPEENK